MHLRVSMQVKFAQQNWHDKLSVILEEFPKVSVHVPPRTATYPLLCSTASHSQCTEAHVTVGMRSAKVSTGQSLQP